MQLAGREKDLGAMTGLSFAGWMTRLAASTISLNFSIFMKILKTVAVLRRTEKVVPRRVFVFHKIQLNCNVGGDNST